MFWKITSLSTSSPVESLLDKENFTLQELLDEEEIIQECKALNSRLINFLRDRAQVEQLLHYIVDEAPEDAESKRVFKFPFISCEIFTCEIDVILKTLVDEEELMNLLFSFLEPNRPRSTLLAGYFSKVVICIMIRKTVPLMNYVQAHQDVFRHLVDLIGITSIMEVLIRLVGADDHSYPNYVDVMQWLAESNLLEMIVDKLSPSSPPEVHANAAETLCAITRNASSALATKLSSPSFVARIFGHALEDSQSKSCLLHSLSVCISLLDPKRSTASTFMFHSFRSQHMYEPPISAKPETISAMLPKLGDLLALLNVSSHEKILPTTYGELRPPLGKHRLKIVEFIAVLLKTANDAAENELVSTGTIRRVIDLFFEYPYNNSLHHHVESIVFSCLDSKSDSIANHLLRECNLIGKILQTDKEPILSDDSNQPTIPAAGKRAPRVGNIGHIRRISNKLVQLGNSQSHIQACLQENSEWSEWQATVLHECNVVENVFRWACGRPTALQDRTRDSDDDELHDRDYDVAALANNLSQAFRYKIYGNEDAEEDHGALDRDDEELAESKDSVNETSSSNAKFLNGFSGSGSVNGEFLKKENEKASASDDMGFFRFETPDNEELFGDRPLPDWVAWGNSSDLPVGSSSVNPFEDHYISDVDPSSQAQLVTSDGSSLSSGVSVLPNGSPTTATSSDSSAESDSSQRSAAVPSLFEEDVEFVGVELEGTEKAMEQALKEGIVGEAGALKRNIKQKAPEEKSDEGGPGMKEFNDANYWRVDQEVAVLE
ncbi:hypothetical protein I3760_14G084200 [Carya illinoinensis]|uniref:SIT4 phosphatase-associated family protein n=1 Tax=Carya illinoinensis TaxID=32201 RepID=A0A922D488_CARIL|nr:hypothetical protein I3760_14G084200 [Carya illinoinensis]KAG6678507.1 hypothetical protein I3842_14G084100 [Carya illinoinensis]